MAINLQKGQKISLSKEASGLTKITMGLGWDAAKKGGMLGGLLGGGDSIDLDASCALFDAKKNCVDSVWYGKLRSKDGSITHTGDNLTGDGDGDDEQIIVDLTKISENVKYLVFTVSSFTGHTFKDVKNCYCRLIDNNTQKEVAKYNLNDQGEHTSQVMVKLYRHNGEWKLHALGSNCSGRTLEQIIPTIVPNL